MLEMTKTEIERITRLETELEHMSRDISAMSVKVDQMHNILSQAKGAQWAVLGMAAFMGFAASKMTEFAAWFGTLPR
jgi:hypothetical protein